jgi:glutamine synthetase
VDNKETPLRAIAPICSLKYKVGASNGGIQHFELKSFDHTASMFLALANVIACGMDGLKRSLKLPPPVVEDPSDL